MKSIIVIALLVLRLSAAQEVEMPTTSSPPEIGLFPLGAVILAHEENEIPEDPLTGRHRQRSPGLHPGLRTHQTDTKHKLIPWA
jgi:hypothetical protein